MSDLISIIVPVYNVEPYLERCMQSIQAQTYTELEIILVDDGSTDASGAMCDRFQREDDRVRVIHKMNGGLSDARNAGMEIAAGAYIGFVDSDDWIEPNMYQSMYEQVKKEAADVVQCRYKAVFSDQTVDKSKHDVLVLTREEALRIYICEHEQYVIQNSVWCKLFTRTIIGELRFPVGRNSEDIMFTTKIFCRMNKCVYLDTAYYNYVIGRAGSIMNERSGRRTLEDEIPFLQEQLSYLQECGYSKLVDQGRYSFYRRMLFYYIELRKRKENYGYAQRIVNLLRTERQQIASLYQKDYVKKGDRIRMKVFLRMPRVYCLLAQCYETYIIPLRNKKG